MKSNDTTLGGGRRDFPATVWSLIESCGDPSAPDRRERLDQLVHLYWKPVYVFLRARHRRSIEDAKDLTQEFFCQMLEGDFLKRYVPERGRFRSFLKGALDVFLADEQRTRLALKRGGGSTTVSIDVDEVEALLADHREDDPGVAFDRIWAEEITARSLEMLKLELKRAGKTHYLAVYEAYVFSEDGAGRPSYDGVARKMGLTVYDVTNYLAYIRRRLRSLILANITDYAGDAQEARDEFKELFA